MNLFEKILLFLQTEMNTPKSYGWFHFLCVFITFLLIGLLYLRKNKHNEKELKWVLAIYGIVALILELLKQISWAFNYDVALNIATWDYEWYAAPFQLCTTPIYVSLICLFLKKSNLRDSLLSYLAFFTILGSLSTIIYPESCFTSDILVNIHTMYLHCGSFVVSVYLLMSKEVKINYENLLKGFLVFLLFAFLANSMNITFYKTGIIGDETFNMFYISPYFISSLPIFDRIQESIPYFFYLLVYLIAIFLGGNIIYLIAYYISNIKQKIIE